MLRSLAAAVLLGVCAWGQAFAEPAELVLRNGVVLTIDAHDTVAREHLLTNLPEGGEAWVAARLEQLLREQNLSQHPMVMSLARVVLSLAA